MRKVICLLLCLLLCASFSLTALAANDDVFVPSIGYKDGPAIKEAVMDGRNVDECLVVTTIEQAEDKTTDISQEDRDLLLEVYESLQDGSMTLPVEGDYVIRELIDLSYEYEDCRQKDDHGDKPAQLKEEGVTLTVTFDVGVGADEEIIVCAYVDGQWIPVDTVNNGDGTVTCTFEDICPVAFAVEDKADFQNPTTGDTIGNQLILAICLMVMSAVAIVALVVTKVRKTN